MKLAATIAVYIAVVILAVLLGIWYFSVKEFELDFNIYRVAEKNDQSVRYVSKTGPPVVVHINGSERMVTINGQDYRIGREETLFGDEYRIRYPNGKTYIVSEQYHMVPMEENGELAGGVDAYVNGRRISFGDQGLRYHPSELIHAAYEKFHRSRGYPVLYWLSIPMFLFGWANFRYEWFQRAMFWASLKWIWVENPEPSDYYFIMSKISGVVIMGLALLMFFQSFSRVYDIIGVL
jgi:hypothetical protein